MSALKELTKRNPKLAPVISTVVCLGVTWERAQSFAQSQSTSPSTSDAQRPQTEKIDLPIPTVRETVTPKTAPETKPTRADPLHTVPLEHRAVQKFDKVKTKQQACALVEGKIVTYYDSASLVVNCSQRPIEDGDLLNELIDKQRKPVAEIPAHIYRLIPFGPPWTVQQNQDSSINKVCNELDGKYVTSTGIDYYFIENCKKRPFSTYVELQAHNKKNAPILTISPEYLDKISSGKPLDGQYDREVGALYKVAGDSTINPLGAENLGKKPVSSADDLAALPQKANGKTVDSKNLCRELNKKVVSFYSQIFFITSNCQKRPIRELPIAVQQRFAERGISITDVSSRQLDSLSTGKELSEDEALVLFQ